MSDSKFRLSRIKNAPVSDAELLADIRRVAAETGTTTVSHTVYSKHGQYNARTISRRFGTWNNGLKIAGVQISHENNISDERLFENVMRLWEHYGRQPHQSELDRSPSAISSKPYKRRFKSWLETLTEFVKYANAQGTEQPRVSEIVSGRRTSRAPSLRLRFRILKRDNFTCCACGATPALTPGLSLHVDHVQAWSLGGETIEENLRTLCEKCNLGKSNVF